MFAHLNSIGLYGMDAFEVNVEADISNGLPGFDVVGLPDAAVKESRDRVRSALKLWIHISYETYYSQSSAG